MIDDNKYQIVWLKIVKLLVDEKVNINITANLGLDILVTTALNAHDGNQKQAAESLKTYCLPEFERIIGKLNNEEYLVEDLARSAVDLVSFDIKNIKAN